MLSSPPLPPSFRTRESSPSFFLWFFLSFFLLSFLCRVRVCVCVCVSVLSASTTATIDNRTIHRQSTKKKGRKKEDVCNNGGMDDAFNSFIYGFDSFTLDRFFLIFHVSFPDFFFLVFGFFLFLSRFHQISSSNLCVK